MMDIKGLNVWGAGQILAFSGLDGETDYNNGLVLRTAFDYNGFEIKLPGNGGEIKFEDFDPENITLSGDFFCIGKNRGAFIDTWHMLMEGNVQLEINDKVKILSKNGKTLLGSREYFRPELIESKLDELIAERHRQLQKFPIPENINEKSRRCLLKAYSQVRTQFYSPEGMIKSLWTTPDRWPHRMMWLWDSVFHAVGIRHLDAKAAREIISAMLGCAREDGFMPLCVSPETDSDITQPPLLSLGVKLVLEKEFDIEWLIKTYPCLKAYIEWDLRNRDSNNSGLLEWKISEDVECRSGESGMDNSPRFDSATQLEATDFNAFISMECEILAEFAAILGIAEDEKLWKERHEKLNHLICGKLWNDKEKFFFDYDINTNKLSDVMASSGFLPLVCGASSHEQAAELLAHLNNPQTFKTAFRVPSVVVCREKYYAKDMWRGPVWINMNWLIARGLRRYGFNEEADSLVENTINEQERMYFKYGTFFEFYDDRNEVEPPELLRKSKNIPDSYNQVLHDYGWSATLYIDFVFEKENRRSLCR